MKLSVITVCRNAATTIEQTIHSVITQSYQDIEFIIVDGASTDATLSVIEAYSSKINCLISEPDKGIYNAMNKGIQIATGDVLFFLNANDSFYDNDVARKIIESFMAHPGVEVVYGDIAIMENDTQLFIKSYRKLTPHHSIYNNLHHQCIFFSKRVFEICGGYDESFVISADTELLLKAVRKHALKYLYVNYIVARYAIGGTSMSKSNAALVRKEAMRWICSYYSFPEAVYGIARGFCRHIGWLFEGLAKRASGAITGSR